MVLFLQATALGRRLSPDIAEIRGALNALAMQRPLFAPLLMLLWRRLHDTLARIDRLADRWRRNRHRPRTRPARQRPPSPAPTLRAPSGHAWLIRLHQPLAQWAPRIEKLINDPEIITLCAAAPQAGRLLRPWCRAFGLTPPPHIARPPAPRKLRPAKSKPAPPPDLREHSPSQWPYVPRRLRLKVPGLRRREPPD